MASGDVAAWQRRLEDTFRHRGVVGGKLLPAVAELERDFGLVFIERFKGHRVITNCFLDFFASTLAEVAEKIQKYGWPQGCPNYGNCLLTFLVLFRSFRAAHVLSQNGYPFDGFAQLRNVKDQILAIAAVANGLSSFPRLQGWADLKGSEKLSEEDHSKIYKKRIQEERRITDLLIGKESGLSEDCRTELEKWNQLFHMQVHGSRFSFFGEPGWWFFGRADTISIGPRYDEDACSMFMNRFGELSWMTTRLLAYLQLPDQHFDTEWSTQWSTLDASQRINCEGLAEIGKKIGEVMPVFLDTKLPYNAASHYEER